jgi:hypothetical protein
MIRSPMVAFQKPITYQGSFRCDDELDRSIIDLPRIEQLHQLGILISELIVGNPGYIENDAAFDGILL